METMESLKRRVHTAEGLYSASDSTACSNCRMFTAAKAFIVRTSECKSSAVWTRRLSDSIVSIMRVQC